MSTFDQESQKPMSARMNLYPAIISDKLVYAWSANR